MSKNRHSIHRGPGPLTAVVLLILTQAGCTPTYVVGDRMADPADSSIPGVRYHLGRDLVVVTVTITESRTRALTPNPSAPLAPEEVDRTTTGAVSIETIADLSSTYLLAMTPGGTADSTIDFGVSPAGLPTSINVSANDRSAEILGNVLEFAARIAGAATGMPSLGGDRAYAAMAPSLPGTMTTEEIAARPAATALATLQQYELLLPAAEATLQRRQTELDLYRQSMPGDAAGISARELTLKAATDAVVGLEKERTEALARFAKAVEAAQSVRAFGPTRRSRTVRFVIPVEDLPSGIDGPRGPEAERLFDATGILVVSEPVGPPPLDAPASAPSASRLREAGCDRPPVRLYFRPTEPWRISVWAIDPTWTTVQATNLTTLKDPERMNTVPATGMDEHALLVSQQVFNVLRPEVPPLMIEFEAAAFSNQSITVGYDANGRLASMKRTGTSSVAGFAEGLSKGAASAQASYTEASSIEADRLTSQKEALEARVAIEKLRKELEELQQQQ